LSDAAVRHLRRDARLRPVIDRVGEYGLRRVRNRYECLVGAIVNQQLAGSAARPILARFRAMYGPRFPRPEAVAATRTAALRRVGLSSMKASYIRGISRDIACGALRLDALSRMDDEAVVERLSRVRGIGRWTAEMYLMFALGRPDVLPVGDYGLRAGVRDLFSMRDLPTPAELRRRAEPWRPYRSVATWYIWKGMRGFGEIG